MEPSRAAAVEPILFRALKEESYQAGLDCLSALADGLPEQKRRLAPDNEDEFCLASALALVAFRKWSERRRQIDGAGGLEAFLRQVVSQTPFYRRAISSVSRGLALADFPIVSKAEIVAEYAAFIADSYATESWKAFKPTSGSTGSPLIVWFDLPAFYEMNYVTYRRVADRWPGFAEQLRVGQVSAVQVTDDPSTWPGSTVLPPLKFTRLVRQVFNLPGVDFDFVARRLNGMGPPLVCGLATSLIAYSELEGESSVDRIRPRGLFVSGETLHSASRARLTKRYSAPLLNAYVSSEGGLVALECALGRMHVADHARVEVVTNAGVVASEGEGELLVTNLMSWAMPFVRYRTGDHGVLRYGECACGFRGVDIARLYGRDAARFKVPTGSVDTSRLDQALGRPEVKDFQVRQETSDRFAVRWVSGDPVATANEVEAALAAAFQAEAGPVDIVFCRERSLRAAGEKIRRYVTEDDVA
jgi:phenylacetate-CoA ligase